MTTPTAKQILKINSRWMVRGELNLDAEAYLAFLFEADRKRFDETIAHTMATIEAHGSDPVRAMTDPKPYFYAAIFFYATKEERAEFLADHLFTRAVLAAARHEVESTPLFQAEIAKATEAKVNEVAQVIASVNAG